MNFTVFDSLIDGVIAVDADLKILYVNPAFLQMTGLPTRRLSKGKDILAAVTFEPNILLESNIRSVVDHTPYREIKMSTESAAGLKVQVTIQPSTQPSNQSASQPAALAAADGQQSWLIFLRDVTLEERLQQKYMSELHQKENVIKRLDRKLFETSLLYEISQAINYSAVDDVLDLVQSKLETAFNFRSSLTTKFEADELVLRPLFFRNRGTGLRSNKEISGPWIAGFKAAILESRAARFYRRGEQPFLDQYLREATGESVSDYLIVPLQQKQTTGFILLLDAISEVRLAAEDISLMTSIGSQAMLAIENFDLYERSIRDGLTGLYNARYFRARLLSEFKRAERSQTKLSMIMIDVDHFKSFNDKYGHAIGDEVLKKVAEVMKATSRETDVPVRYGGEEFAVILPETDTQGVQLAAERFRSAIEKSVLDTQFGALRVTASLGCATFPTHTLKMEDLAEYADQALYAAKRSGRNNCKLYAPEMTQEAE